MNRWAKSLSKPSCQTTTKLPAAPVWATSGAAGFRLGLAVIAPGNLTRRSALVAAAKPAVRMMYGAALMFGAAAFVEAFWSPLTEVPFAVKISAGIAGWGLLLLYFAFAGRAHAAR